VTLFSGQKYEIEAADCMHKKIVTNLASASDVHNKKHGNNKNWEFGSTALIVVSRGRFLTKFFAPK
jgi:hypothetical protein